MRTFDPEGTIFYGDTKDGEDWFVLSLRDGVPLMQISKDGMFVSVAGGPKLDDGKWHTVSSGGRTGQQKINKMNEFVDLSRSSAVSTSCSPGAAKLEVSSHGKFVILRVDGSSGLEVGMQSKRTEEVISGELRLALGGILIDKDNMIVEVKLFLPSFLSFLVVWW